MPTIEVSDQQAEEIKLLVKVWKTTPDVVVRRLIDHFKYSRPAAPDRSTDSIPVHAVYKEIRTEGEYHVHSSRLTITAGPLAGQRFRTPSAAAAAVISLVDPSVVANRTGWRFWIITESDERLQVLRHLHQ